MKKIKLTKNQYAVVDDDDYEQLMLFNWHASPSSGDKNKYYACCNVGKTRERKRKRISMHRFIMKFPEDLVIDHINGDSLDNRKINLRAVTQLINTRNQRKRKGSSKYKGVKKHVIKSKTKKGIKIHEHWRADIMINYKKYFLGLFDNEESARDAYIKATKELCGEMNYG